MLQFDLKEIEVTGPAYEIIWGHANGARVPASGERKKDVHQIVGLWTRMVSVQVAHRLVSDTE